MERQVILTIDERMFIGQQGLSPEDFFDARGKSKSARDQIAIESGKRYFIGAACKLAGHRLRTKAGHCIQCDTSKIAYNERSVQLGFVYIAGSQAMRLIKIGLTNSPHTRQSSLCSQRYGEAQDWKLLRYLQTKNAGRLENKLLNNLHEFRFPTVYLKNGNWQNCYETFRCQYDEASRKLASAIVELNLSPEKDWQANDEICREY